MAGYGFGGQHTPAPKRKKIKRKAPPRSVAQSVLGASRDVTRGTKAPVRRVTKTARPKRANVAPTPPGPITNRDRAKIRKHKRTKQYKKSLKVARKAKQRITRRNDALATLRFLKKASEPRFKKRALSGLGDDLGPLRAFEGIAKEGGSVALDVLEETTRPVHGFAGASLEAAKGKGYKSQQKAFVRGVKNEDKYLFSDVLKELGAPKGVASVGGFALDVALDPTTYLTGGTASVGKKLALKESERVFKKAKAAGMTDEGAKTVAKRAERNKLAKLEKEGKNNKGLTIGIGKHRTSGKTTAAISRRTGISAAAKRVRGSKPVQTLGENLHPGFRPKGATEKAHRKVRRAARKHRSEGQAGQKRAQNVAIAYSKVLSPKDHRKVIDALESGSLRSLDDRLRPIAKRMRDDYRHMLRKERQAGIAGGKVRDYFPHVPRHVLEPGAPKPKTSAANLASSKQRKIKKTLKKLRDEDPSLFSEDVPLVFGHRAAASARGTAKAAYLKAVAETGRRLTPETRIDTAIEAAYKVTPKAITKFDSLDDALKAARRGERVLVLNRATADRALKQTAPREGPAAELGRAYDRKLQGPVKTILTVPNPQYHFTNLYGDLFNAYLADTKLRSFAKSAGALRRLAKREAAVRTLGKQLDPTSKGVRIGGAKVGYDDLIREAEENGAIRTGFIGRDLPDVLDAQAKEFAERMGKGRVGGKLGAGGQKALRSKVGHAVAHPIDTIRDASQYREDFVRLATYIEARKAGLAPAKAAERVAKHHFDYGDLTEFERNVLRRVFPFYTFTARNTPLQAHMLATKPGKYANLQKAREEFAKSAGLEPGWEDKLEDYEQRGLPFPLPMKDSLGHPIALYPKLPAMDLGRLTVNPQEQARYFAAMVTPIFKSPFELAFDYNLFFGEPITNKDAPLVPAPEWVEKVGPGGRRLLGVKRFVDKRTGEKIWGWPAKVDYVARLTPASATAIQLGTDAKNRRGQDRWMKLFGYGTGLKLSPVDPQKAALNGAFEEREKLEEQMAALRQQGLSKRKDGTYRPKYDQLLDRSRKLSERIYRLKKKSGYKILPTTGEPPSMDERIERALGESDDVDDRIERALTGGGDVDKRIAEALGE